MGPVFTKNLTTNRKRSAYKVNGATIVVRFFVKRRHGLTAGARDAYIHPPVAFTQGALSAARFHAVVRRPAGRRVSGPLYPPDIHRFGVSQHDGQHSSRTRRTAKKPRTPIRRFMIKNKEKSK